MTADRRQVRAWLAYDWANSAWAMTVAVAVLPVYFAGTVVPKGGVELFGFRLDATVLWGYVNSASTLAVFLTAPILGAIADRLGARRALLSAFGIAGGLLTTLLGFCGKGDVATTLWLYALSQFAFVSANVFYDSFLPHLAKDEELDRLSARGFAVGYVGGSVHFVLALGLMATHARWGLSAEAAARIALASAGLWWAGFGTITFLGLREPGRDGPGPGLLRAVRDGVADTLATTRRVAKVKPVLLFLLAFVLYNDGVQTVIKMASLYGTEEVGVGMPLMMGTLLGIQLLAMVGALAFARLAEAWGTKRALLLAVALWLVAVAWAYVLKTPAGFVALAALAGLRPRSGSGPLALALRRNDPARGFGGALRLLLRLQQARRSPRDVPLRDGAAGDRDVPPRDPLGRRPLRGGARPPLAGRRGGGEETPRRAEVKGRCRGPARAPARGIDGFRSSGSYITDQVSALKRKGNVAFIWARCCARKPRRTTFPFPSVRATAAAFRVSFSSPRIQPDTRMSRASAGYVARTCRVISAPGSVVWKASGLFRKAGVEAGRPNVTGCDGSTSILTRLPGQRNSSDFTRARALRTGSWSSSRRYSDAEARATTVPPPSTNSRSAAAPSFPSPPACSGRGSGK